MINTRAGVGFQPLVYQPDWTTSPLLSSRESRFYMHMFITETAPRLFPASPELFLRRMIASALETPHLLHALLASACSHHGRLIKDPSLNSKASFLKFTNLSISGLRSVLCDKSPPLTAESVATAMALCTNDVCHGNMHTWRTHLHGVMRLFSVFLDGQPTPYTSDPYVQFLTKWFITMDSLAGLSGLSNQCILSSPSELLERVFDRFDTHVNDICGYSLKLAPLLARLSDLLCRRHGGFPWAQDLAIEAQTLETELQSLTDCSAFVNGNFPGIQSTHLAFVHSTLLHTHRRVQRLPRNHDTVQTDIRNILSAIMSIPPFSSGNILILWPIFSAGCEADDDHDRELIYNRMGDMETLGMGSFTRARELLAKYWASETTMPWDAYFANLGCELVLF